MICFAFEDVRVLFYEVFSIFFGFTVAQVTPS
jgi:hypothetical protein